MADMSTMVSDVQSLRYPVGRYQPPSVITSAVRSEWLQTLAELPDKLENAVSGLTDERLDTPYRDGGWTVRQVVHHYPDSHMNSYIRFKLAVTESTPLVKPYEESAWAELPDAKSSPVQPSLQLLRALHQRFVVFLRSLDDADFSRSFKHPELGEIRLDWTLGMYAWHSRHHVAQITALRERKGW